MAKTEELSNASATGVRLFDHRAVDDVSAADGSSLTAGMPTAMQI